MGFLNATPEDDEAMALAGARGSAPLPGPSFAEGALSAIPQGVVSGLENVARAGVSLVNALPTGPAENMGEAMPDAPMAGAPPPGATPSAYDQNASKTAAAIQKWSALDPSTQGQLAGILHGVSQGITEAGAGGLVGGPIGAAAVYGGTTTVNDYQDGVKAGFDPITAGEKAVTDGTMAAASAFLPMNMGGSLLGSLAKGAAINVGLGALQRGTVGAILDANGYKKQAAMYHVFDAQQMEADTILGAAFGAFGAWTHEEPPPGPRPPPADVDAAAGTAVNGHFERSAPGVVTDPAFLNVHSDFMSEALDAMGSGRTPNIPEAGFEALLDHTIPDPDNAAAVGWMPHVAKALWGDAWTGLTEPVEPSPVPLDEAPRAVEAERPESGLPPELDMQLRQLNDQYPGLHMIDEDGEAHTMDDLAQRMRQQFKEAGPMSQLHDVAMNCFAASGGG